MQLLSTSIIIGIYAAIAIGHIPGLRMNRATIALVGAALLVLVGAISEDEALRALDLGTLLLLGAMMVLNVNLRLAGFFRFISNRTLRMAASPRVLLALVIVSSGVLSALFLNDTICLMVTPLLVDIVQRLKRDPIPYLIGLGTATNIGSVATITGNPQNIIIGQSSGIPYLTFAAYLTPVAVVGLFIAWGVIVLLYRAEFSTPLPEQRDLPPPRPYTPLLARTMLVIALMLVAFLAGAPIVTTACAAAGALLISKLRPGKLLAIDWELLALFAGLFVVTGAIEVTGLSDALFASTAGLLKSGIPAFSIAVGVLSNLVSNVPAVLLLRPQIASFPDPQQTWLVLAMASTLAGNFTLLGSAATLIVAELAALKGARLTFTAFLRAGIPITILTMLVGMIWLSVVA